MRDCRSSRASVLYVLLICPNRLSSLSRYQASVTKFRPLYALEWVTRTLQGVIWKPLFDFVDPVGAYRPGVGPYLTTFRPPDLDLDCGKKFDRRASLINLYPPTKFHQDQTKSVDGRTDGHRGFMRPSLRTPSGNDVRKEDIILSSTWSMQVLKSVGARTHPSTPVLTRK